MKINRTKLYLLYMDRVAEISEACDWKSVFGPEEIVNLVADIIEYNPDLLGPEPNYIGREYDNDPIH